jgi:hypothetical protein
MKRNTTPALAATALAAALLFPAAPAEAHCDSVEGPVVVDAKAALGRGDVAPVLKWVSAAQEAEVRDAFQRSLAVRKLGAEAQQLADTAFFETLVRLHRETEGAAYTGLKRGVKEPAFIGNLESALASGSVDGFSKLVGEHAAARVKEKFAVALEAKSRVDASPADGRTYVAAYVDLMHSTKAIVEAVHGGSAGHAAPTAHGPKGSGHSCD